MDGHCREPGHRGHAYANCKECDAQWPPLETQIVAPDAGFAKASEMYPKTSRALEMTRFGLMYCA